MKITLNNKEIELTQEEVNEIIKQLQQPKEEKIVCIAIKNRWTGDIIFQSSKTTWKDAVEESIKSKADLSEADLSEANLSKADLSEANLSKANLSEANLSKANLSEANLSKADLSEANLSWANLSEANLSWANLSKADLSKADLSWANLSEADLNGCLFYMGNGNRNFEALCKAIKTIRHQDGKFEDLVK